MKLSAQQTIYKLISIKQRKALTDNEKKAIDNSIKALERLREYREIGTIEEFKALKEKAEEEN